jgi:predicted DNA binding protein
MRAVEIRLRPDSGAFPGVDTLLQGADDVARRALVNLDWHNDGSYTMLYRLDGSATDQLRSALDSNDDVMRSQFFSDSSALYLFVHVSEVDPFSELLAIVDDNALLLEPPFQFTDQGVLVTVAGEERALQTAFDEVIDRITVDVEWMGGYAPARQGALARLTERQREALIEAYELGYYETPRSVSFEEVAAELDCSSSTANELLRRAEATVIESVLQSELTDDNRD